MKRSASTILAAALCAAAVSPALAGPVRISQVYGGGGGSTTPVTYRQDYVELFNASGAVVNVGGWVVAYASATGTFGTNNYTLPAGTAIQPCGYLLVAVGTVGAAGAAFPVTPDLVNTAGPNLNNTAGKVALLSGGSPGTGVCATGSVEDAVCYGSSSACEGTPVGAVSRTTAAVRKLGGLQDTNDNATDLDLITAPTPRSSASPRNPDCLTTPAMPSTWGRVKSIYR